jgi:hypothetical protein
LPNQASWGVTPTTAKLLSHWRSYEFEGLRPFFCQVEAVETMIWLTEVARGRRQYAHIWKHLEAANEQANPELFRLAMKMATGAGKTTVMAMLIAWQTANAVRSPGSSLFSKGFLIVTPGITIRDRLRVLLPSDPENYYETRNLVPPDMVGDVRKAKVEIVNYHVFKRRETDGTNKVSRGIRAGWRNDPRAPAERYPRVFCQPIGLVPIEIRPRCNDHRKAIDLGNLAENGVHRDPLARIGEHLEAVDEQNGTPARSQIAQIFLGGGRDAEGKRHLRPSTWGRVQRIEHDRARLVEDLTCDVT